MDLTKKRKLEENGVVLPPDSSAAATTTTTTLTSDDLRKVIEPFTNEQLSQIVLTAALRHADVLAAVRSIADRDPTQRKLFIRGLGWETTTEKLRSLFANYGDLEEAIVILDKVTGKSKGYGFVTYKHVDSALMALKEPNKKIDGRMTVTNLASAGISGGVSVMKNLETLDDGSRKIYVGNVPNDMAKERLLAHFESYGEIEKGPLGFDKVTGKFRGFALFIYKNVEGARACLVDPIKSIDGHKLNCKIADDKKKGSSGGMDAAPVVAVAVSAGGQVQGLGGDRVKSEVSNLNQQSAMQGSYASQFGGGPGGIYGGNMGGLGVAGPGGVSVYGGGGGGGQVPPLSHSQLPVNSNMGGGIGLNSFGGNGGPGLSTNGSHAPNPFGGGSGPGLSTNGSHAPNPFGGGSGGGGGYGGAGVSYGGLGGGGGGFGGLGQRSVYGLPPGPVRMNSGGYPPESAHYSLSSGSAYQSQQQQQQQKTGMASINRVPTGGAYHGPPYKL